MLESVSLADYNAKFYFGFFTNDGVPAPPDARIGSFEVLNIKTEKQPDGSAKYSEELVGIREMDKEAFQEDAELLALFPLGMEGIYSAKDSSKLVVDQNIGHNIVNPSLQFRLCKSTGTISCASNDEVKEFFDSHTLVFAAVDNFVNFDEVKPIDQSLERVLAPYLSVKIKPEEPQYLRIQMQESRIQLHDSKYDALELFQPEEIKFFNFAPLWLESSIYSNIVNQHFTI